MVKELAKKAALKSLDKLKKLKAEVRKNIAKAGAAAFAFLIALAWRDAIVEIVNKLIENIAIPEVAYIYKGVTALIITVVCIIGIWATSKIVAKEQS